MTKILRHYSARASIHVHGSGTAEAVFSGLVDVRSLAALQTLARDYAGDVLGWLLDFSLAALMLPDGPVEGLAPMTGVPIAIIAPDGFSALSLGRESGVICVAFSPAQSALAALWLARQQAINSSKSPALRRCRPSLA